MLRVLLKDENVSVDEENPVCDEAKLHPILMNVDLISQDSLGYIDIFAGNKKWRSFDSINKQIFETMLNNGLQVGFINFVQANIHFRYYVS